MLKNPTHDAAAGGPVEFEDSSSQPLITVMLILGAIAGYIGIGKNVESSIALHCWSVNNINAAIHASKWMDLVNYLGFANFACFNMFHMFLSVYFIWVFGSHLEGRLGNGRYFLLVLLGLLMPWLVLQWDAQGVPSTTFFGVSFLCFCMIGGYVIVPPVPLKKYGTGNMAQKHVVRKKEHKHDMRAKWIANPWMFIATFGAAQILFHFWVTMGFRNPMDPTKYLLEPLTTEYDTFRLLPSIVALGCGYMVAQMAVNSAQQAFNEGPMALSAIKRYRELLELDVKHDDAVKGTARTLGLSYEKTKELINRNKNKMRIK